MDQFVQHQLTKLGHQDLIPIFRDNGYNEELYRKLTLSKLVQLLPAPDNDDFYLVSNFMRNIESLKNNPTVNLVQFPPPSVVVKTDTCEEIPGADNDDDEVEIVEVIVRVPSGFNVVEIKNEIPEPVEESGSGISTAENGLGPFSPLARTNSTTIDIGPARPVPNEDSSRTCTLRLTSSDNSRSSSSGIVLTNLPGTSASKGQLQRSSRIRKASMPLNNLPEFGTEQESDSDEDWQPREKISRIDISSSYEKKRVLSMLKRGRVGSQKGRILRKVNFDENFEVKFSTDDELDLTLELLEKFRGKLSNAVKRLELNDTSDGGCLISNAQVQRLANLPRNLWCRLTTLVFGLSFPEDIDFNIITTILSKCTSLQKLDICRGTFLSGNEVKTLQVPAMNMLVSFKFAALEKISATSYVKPCPVADPVNVEADTYRNRQLHPKFRIDFGARTYPMLQTLEVGSLTDLNFGRLSQFPHVQRLDLGYGQENLLSKQDGKLVLKELHWTCISSALSWNSIRELPRWYPNLTKLYLHLPNTETICGVVRFLVNLRIKHLQMWVSFEFESALINALCGLPYKLVTENDKTRMAKLKKYKHWKAFVAEFKIEIPREELFPDNDNAESIKDLDRAELTTIGSFKHLKCLKIRRLRRTLHIPEGDLHWNNPEVNISTDAWSSSVQVLPSCILLEELVKLKGTLAAVNLVHYKVDPKVAIKFQHIMGYEIRYGNRKICKPHDTLNLADLETDVGKRVKQERQQ